MIKEFVYIDSSEQQENEQILRSAERKKRDQQQQINEQKTEKLPKHKNCLFHNPQTHLLCETPYEMFVKNLLNEKISEQMKNQLITNIEDIEIASNINKRNLNYEYFIKKMQIDQKYRAIQQEKADKIRMDNERKKKVLYKHQSQKQLKSQEMELKKFIVEKKQKQDRVVDHLKKNVRKFGFQRIYNAHKKMKEQIKNKQKLQQDQIASRLSKQRNEILQLQEQYEAIKEAKRLNKIQQRKVIKDLTQKIHNQKNGLNQKLTKRKTFEV